MSEVERADAAESQRHAVVHVGGMSCAGCEQAVRRALLRVDGVTSVTASTPKGEARVAFAEPCTAEALSEAIDASGYSCLGVEVEGEAAEGAAEAGNGATAETAAAQIRPARSFDAVYLIIIAVGLFLVAQNLGVNQVFQSIPTISGQNLGYTVLFGIGLLTSVHCIAMCGGINLAQSTALGAVDDEHRRRGPAIASSLLYNAGRLTSYTVIGGVLGAVGQAASISLGTRAAVGLVAGVFMLLAGIGMAGGFPFLSKLAPRMPRSVMRAAGSIARRGPYALGLVNGFMPCGPLQAMQVYAISSGSFAAGALSMFSFCLGTIPLVLGFGVIAGTLRRSWKQTMLRAASVMMVVFGLFMLQSNLALTGVRLPSLPFGGPASGLVAATQQGGAQTVTTQLRADGYDGIQVKAGVPVTWTIHAAAGTLNGCNSEIVLPDFGQQVKLQNGDTVIKFTPDHAGTYNFSCWMGMLHGQIVAS